MTPRPARCLATLFALLAALSVQACGGFNLDPGPGREVRKAEPSLTAPPPGLLGTARR